MAINRHLRNHTNKSKESTVVEDDERNSEAATEIADLLLEDL